MELMVLKQKPYLSFSLTGLQICSGTFPQKPTTFSPFLIVLKNPLWLDDCR